MSPETLGLVTEGHAVAAALSSSAGMWGAVGAAALAGLVGSPHCVGMCGGFAVAAGNSARTSIAWTAGRLSTYAALGALAGAFGHIIPGPLWLGNAVAAALLVWFAIRLAGGAPALPGGRLTAPLTRVAGRLMRRDDLPSRYLFGATNGLLPCGLVYAALAFPVAVASPAWGALSMVAFGLGTAPALSFAAVGLRKLTARSLTARRVLAAGVLLLGLGSMAMRAGLEPPASPDEEVSCH